MPKTILVVDDDGLIRRSLANILRQSGFIVIEANSGKDGLEKVKAGGVNLIVTDIKMPEMDGMEMVSKLRKTAEGKDLRVIILSTDDETTSVNKALEVGITTYLSKTTLDLETIAKQIISVLQ